MGRANRFLAPRVTAIATGFRTLKNFNRHWQSKITFTGNPLRPPVIAAADVPYAAPADGKLRLLVFGGSQGARVMAEIVPAAIERLDARIGTRALSDRAAGAGRGPRRRARHLCPARRCRRDRAVLSRPAGAHGGGASGDFALRRLDRGRAFGHRPAGHLGAAAACAGSGPVRQCRRSGGRRRGDPHRAARLHARRLATEIAALAGDPARLAQMAQAAKSAGTIDAAERLADLVIKGGGNLSIGSWPVLFRPSTSCITSAAKRGARVTSRA